MKRTTLFLLMLCLFFSLPASADRQRALRLWNVQVKQSFWSAHPDIRHETVWMDPAAKLSEWIVEAQPDVMEIALYNDDLRRLMDAGLTADLSGISPSGSSSRSICGRVSEASIYD